MRGEKIRAFGENGGIKVGRVGVEFITGGMGESETGVKR